MGTALVRYGNIFQRSVDLTVLPQSAKGTFSDWVRSHQDNYGIPKPSPLELGRVSDPILFTGSGNITKYVVYAASVRNDKSTPEVISEIGFRLGELTFGIEDIRLLETPILGAGAGHLPRVLSAKALRSGFSSSSWPDAALLIWANNTGDYKRILTYFNELAVIEKGESPSLTKDDAKYALKSLEKSVTASAWSEASKEYNGVMALLNQIYEKLNAPKKTAVAKLKTVLPFYPELVALELELDIGQFLKEAWTSIKKKMSFGKSTK